MAGLRHRRTCKRPRRPRAPRCDAARARAWRAGEGVAPRVHRRRARVRRWPCKLTAWRSTQTSQYHAQRQVQRLEHRALLDVQLEVGSGVSNCARASARGRGRRHAQRGHRVASCRRVSPLRSSSWSHRAGGRARAEQRAPEARAFLVGPVHEPHGDGGPPSSASRRSTSTPAMTLRHRPASRRSAPSRHGRR